MLMSTPQLRLVTRGDDAGSCGSANRAILEACEQGILRNVSIMVPGPAFEEAAKLFAHRPDICLGLHVTLNAEWDGPKWGPVLPLKEVPSLVDENGYFFPTPKILYERGFEVEEVVAEVQAQLNKARAYGLNISYLDEHMGLSWLPGLRKEFANLAKREGLVDAHPLRHLPMKKDAGGNSADRLIASLQAATPGDYIFVTHPGYDADDMRLFQIGNQEPGSVARERDADRLLLLDPRVREACQYLDVEVVLYTDVLT